MPIERCRCLHNIVFESSCKGYYKARSLPIRKLRGILLYAKVTTTSVCSGSCANGGSCSNYCSPSCSRNT
jgi:hypothetical protein